MKQIILSGLVLLCFSVTMHGESEELMMAARAPKIVSALQKIMKEQKLPFMPKIGVAIGGGGFTAAGASLGLLRGLEDIDVLDGISYVSAGSGAAWFLSSWLKNGYDLEALEDRMKTRFSHAFMSDVNVSLAKDLLNTFQSKRKDGRSFGFNDIWGELLGHVFLDQESSLEMHYVDSVAESLLSGAFPLPIFTSVVRPYRYWHDCLDSNFVCCSSTTQLETINDYKVFEYSPFTVGLVGTNHRIPTQQFGCAFKAGQPVPGTYRETWNYLLGVWGSNYAFSFKDVWQDIMQVDSLVTHLIPSVVKNFMVRCFSGSESLAYPEVCNFMYGCNDQKLGWLANEQYVETVDIGKALGVPFTSLMHRDTDIYIICDVSFIACATKGEIFFNRAQEYAHFNGYQFPKINQESIIYNKDGIMLIFDKDDKQAPIVLYITTSLGESYLDQDYTSDKFDRMVDDIRQRVAAETESLIKQAIELCIAKH